MGDKDYQIKGRGPINEIKQLLIGPGEKIVSIKMKTYANIVESIHFSIFDDS